MATSKEEFAIENDIPMPKGTRRVSSHSFKFPLLEMKVGQSILIPKIALGSFRTQRKQLSQDGKWWAMRKIADNQYRVWRVL